jgi:agmatine deiminase
VFRKLVITFVILGLFPVACIGGTDITGERPSEPGPAPEGASEVVTNQSLSNASPDEQAAPIRVPAEWEPHAATWMQWPGTYETVMRKAFSDIIKIVQQYEPVHILTSTEQEMVAAQHFLAEQGVPDKNITWHIIPVDNSWMRDNGPIYITDGTDIRIQNWGFTGWDGTTGAYYNNDNLVPDRVAEIRDIEVIDYTDYVLEKGNLEVNGAGLAVLNRDCQDDRNPGMEITEHEAILKEALGLTEIIWASGHDSEDITTGHIDGTARFIATDTLVVADYYGTRTERELAAAAEDFGLEVVRYPGDPNWLVGNGFVVAMSEGDRATDAHLKSQIESFFPGRDVFMVNAHTIAESGGGIHCVTNDEPAVGY